MTSKEALECIVVDLVPKAKEYNKEEIEQLRKSLKVLEIIKNHILNVGIDISGIYLKKHYNGLNVPYYTIEIKEGIKKIVSMEEFDLLKEWIENDK